MVTRRVGLPRVPLLQERPGTGGPRAASGPSVAFSDAGLSLQDSAHGEPDRARQPGFAAGAVEPACRGRYAPAATSLSWPRARADGTAAFASRCSLPRVRPVRRHLSTSVFRRSCSRWVPRCSWPCRSCSTSARWSSSTPGLLPTGAGFAAMRSTCGSRMNGARSVMKKSEPLFARSAIVSNPSTGTRSLIASMRRSCSGPLTKLRHTRSEDSFSARRLPSLEDSFAHQAGYGTSAPSSASEAATATAAQAAEVVVPDRPVPASLGGSFG